MPSLHPHVSEPPNNSDRNKCIFFTFTCNFCSLVPSMVSVSFKSFSVQLLVRVSGIWVNLSSVLSSINFPEIVNSFSILSCVFPHLESECLQGLLLHCEPLIHPISVIQELLDSFCYCFIEIPYFVSTLLSLNLLISLDCFSFIFSFVFHLAFSTTNSCQLA